ncbi:M3 family metallopeptidase [Echinimonas agarilytica]|uniref:M3 family metallopeptidase n=1 Tax=Echinimonas agarilytica TaxID=1215918 RepID=A0AA41W788_9GAMM|nr:M3 family metallopeptidase [Echinimonas agarilytica]MCM2679723.1 M3 family metallopeptidase [Echinimonas agarilytica]
MPKRIITLACASVLTALVGCGETTESTATTESKAPMQSQPEAPQKKSANTLLADWAGPYQGVPAFDKMALSDLKAALETAMAEGLVNIEAIANNPAPASFDNTIAALEGSTQTLDRVFTYYYIWMANNSSEEYRSIQGEMVPALSAFSSQITQNKALFNRIETVFKNPSFKDLRADQQRLTQIVYGNFARNGSTLEGEAKDRYAEIETRLAELYTKFSNNVLHDEQNYVIYLDESQLSGLPKSFVSAAKAAAETKGENGKYAVSNTRSSMDPFLTYSEERALREQVWRSYYSRGDNGDEYDNNAIIAEILKLREERVQLLGYDNYAQWRLEDRMAGSPDNAMALLESVWPAAIARVNEEVADMQAIADAESSEKITIEPWDYRFYAEKVRKAKYDLDSNEVKQYLQLDKLREAMFYVAGRLFNFEFTPITDGSVPVFHEDVNVWEVTDKTTKQHIGLWYLDPFAREGKRSGAWATTYRQFSDYDGVTNVLASNNSNFVKGAAGAPVLVSWDDAETFFHEFGHALHYLSSSVSYPSLSGGVRDYTEFQSQLLERWLMTDEVINQFLTHVDTGKPMPAELLAKIKNAATFNEGFATTEYLASAIIDLKLHMVEAADIDPDAFERDTLTQMGMPKELVMRHRTPHFGHVFSGEGYSAGYYGYMWAEVLTSDAAAAFDESEGGYYDPVMADKLVKHLFQVQNSVDPAEAYRAFRGRDANVEALMRDRGFPINSEQ